MKALLPYDIAPWRESLTAMDEPGFFGLMRLYLGEIKTPYNKQKLIEALTSFLHKEENRRVLIKLLSREELMIIGAVLYIPFCTKEKTAAFFSPTFSFSFLHNAFLNLEERLILFRRKDAENAKEYFDVNPLLLSDIEPLINTDLLFPQTRPLCQVPARPEASGWAEGTDVPAVCERHFLSARLLASWFAFTAENPDCCRSDGSFKKKTHELVGLRFPEILADFLQKIHKALLNLSLFRKKEVGRETLFEPDFAKWKRFALLAPLSRASYIAAAFCLADCSSAPYGVPRDELQKTAVLVRDFLLLMPRNGLSRQNAQRLLFLLKERQGEFPQKENRFRRLLRENCAAASAGSSESDETLTIESLTGALILFGLLRGSAAEKKRTGKNRDEAFEVFTVNSELYAPSSLRGSDGTGSELLDNSISINAGFSITVLKELPLSVFIELASCTELESCTVVASFRITKAASLRAFAGGAKPEGIESLLKKTASHELPQNLLFSLREWYALYSSGSLFKGYVLQVADDKRVLVENNPSLAPHIRIMLSPGVYLLDFLNDDEAFETIRKSGLEFIGGLKNSESGIEPLPFERLDTAARFSGGTDGLDVLFAKKSTNADSAENEEFCENHLRQMETELKKMNLPKEQKEELLLRINRKTIVHSAQLRSDSVRPEKTEAFGMDFLGKIHVLESAIAFSDLVEINSAGGIVTGFPVKIEKSAGDAVLVLQSDDVKNADIKNGTESQKISVAQARSVKRIRSSVLGRTK
ncbi:hypothetical protein [Treponema maltophilum]|uniref:hypothetical protein n=1 Tax=Treponema maltophilum TaxID=51160 RepID=UPI003D8D8BFF